MCIYVNCWSPTKVFSLFKNVILPCACRQVHAKWLFLDCLSFTKVNHFCASLQYFKQLENESLMFHTFGYKNPLYLIQSSSILIGISSHSSKLYLFVRTEEKRYSFLPFLQEVLQWSPHMHLLVSLSWNFHVKWQFSFHCPSQQVYKRKESLGFSVTKTTSTETIYLLPSTSIRQYYYRSALVLR